MLHKIIILLFFSLYTFAEEKELIEIYKNIKCLTCQGQSIYESNSDFAKDIKNIIQEEYVNNHTTKADIEKKLVERFGEDILFKPQIQFSTYILWFTPFILLFFVIIKIFAKFYKNENR